jgi:hypothetical protein
MKSEVAELYGNLSKHLNRAPLTTILHEVLHAFSVYLDSNSLNIYRNVSNKRLGWDWNTFNARWIFPGNIAVFMSVSQKYKCKLINKQIGARTAHWLGTGWLSEKPWFDSRQRKAICVFSTALRTALAPTQSLIQCVPEAFPGHGEAWT